MNDTKNAKVEWPKLRVRYCDGREGEILTMEKASEQYGLDDRTINWFRQGGLAGTRPNKNGGDVEMLELYTSQDALRDAAPDLLSALKGLLGTWLTNGLCPFGKGRMLSCECNYHAALDAAHDAWNKAEGR